MGSDKDETERAWKTSDFIISDAVTEHEQKFVFPTCSRANTSKSNGMPITGRAVLAASILSETI